MTTVSPLLIQNAGTPNLGDILSQSPALAFTGTIRANSNNFGNGAGISSIDLRGLGASRTLVLVDGLRHVAGDLTSNAVDVNSIPTALVDHVEIAGLDGDFDVPYFHIKWDGALNYGRTESRFVNNSLMITSNFAAALDSVKDPVSGKPVCRTPTPSALDGSPCVPFNPFGIQNTPAALAYSFGSFPTRDYLSQEDAVLNFRTDTGKFFNLQGGPVQLAFGAEYRMERTYERNDPFLLSGKTENLANNSSGGYNVGEVYIEGDAPIFRHQGFLLDELSLNAAYRGAQYSFDKVDYVDSYKFGGVYGPFADLKFRGTYSRAIRAPNITEAFLPASSSYFNITDPCDVTNIGSNVNYAKNCAAAGIPPNFAANTNASIVGQTSGNPNLDTEKSIIYTGGVVLQPHWIPRLAITLDYYSIKIKNAITNVAAQDIINNCYGSSSGLNQQYCSLFTRGPNQQINFVSTTYVNAAKLFTDGVDLQVNYNTPVSGLTSRYAYTRWLNGRLGFDMTVNFTHHLDYFPFQENPSQRHITAGTTNFPHVKGLAELSYVQGPVQLVWTTRYIGRSANYNLDSTSADRSEANNAPFAPQRFYHSIAVHYQLDRFYKGAEVFGGVNDIFDEDPPFQLIGAGADLAYDLGRYAFIGVRFRQ